MIRRGFPSDVIVLDSEWLLHARVLGGSDGLTIPVAKRYSLPADTFSTGVITPAVLNPEALKSGIRRIRNEQGRLDRVSLLLPDSWFRINILDVTALPNAPAEADEMVRWSLKRTLPIRPEELRMSWVTLSRSGADSRVLVVSALDASLAGLEQIFKDEKLTVALIEPLGLNLWNAIAAKEADTTGDRLFLYVRERDFTTAVFRGSTPLFIRSRNLSGERSLEQELKISAAYLRNTLQNAAITRCYLAGSTDDPALAEVVTSAFGAPASRVSLREHVRHVGTDVPGIDAELTACTGVFAA